jgi:hypothetical protein
MQRLQVSEATAHAAAEAAWQQLREANAARLAAAAAAADSGSSSGLLAAEAAGLRTQLQREQDEARQLSHQVDALQVRHVWSSGDAVRCSSSACVLACLLRGVPEA